MDNDTERPESPASPEPGQDSRVEDWFGQSVQRDAELADALVDEVGEEEAGRRFDEEADGAEEQRARHGSSIDPEQGESAYRDAATDTDEVQRPDAF